MPIRVFPPHYQLVYINFDISSFSLISYKPIGRLLHCKRASLTPQKSIFYFTKNHLLSPIYESLLQPSYALFPFIISEYLSLYITRTTPLKRLFFNFPVIPYLCYNTLITSRLYEMLKVTATKNKKYFGI